jgi:hypothetical protein
MLTCFFASFLRIKIVSYFLHDSTNCCFTSCWSMIVENCIEPGLNGFILIMMIKIKLPLIQDSFIQKFPPNQK